MEHKEDLIKHRLQRASQTLEEAELAIANSKWTLAENRIYYAIFYAVSALALKSGYSTAKHSPLLGWFNQMFIKTGQLDIRFGKIYAKAFEKRQKADYDDYTEFQPEEVNTDFQNAKEFLIKIKEYLNVCN